MASAVVASAFGGASKVSGSIADIFTTDSMADGESNHRIRRSPDNLMLDLNGEINSPNQSIAFGNTYAKGVTYAIQEGRDYFVQSIVAGLSGVVEEPVKGMSEGMMGAVKGTCRGVLGLVSHRDLLYCDLDQVCAMNMNMICIISSCR